jgi:hypothetical protein
MPFMRNGESKIRPSNERKRDNATYACPGGKLAKHQAQLCQMSIPGFYEPLWPANLMDNAQKFPNLLQFPLWLIYFVTNVLPFVFFDFYSFVFFGKMNQNLLTSKDLITPIFPLK